MGDWEWQKPTLKLLWEIHRSYWIGNFISTYKIEYLDGFQNSNKIAFKVKIFKINNTS